MRQGKEEGLRQGKEEGLRQGKKEGLRQGKKEGFKEAAKRMKEKGISIEHIVEITGLTKEEIKKL